MDRTLNPVKRGNRRRRARNQKAWQLFSTDSPKCPFCPHGYMEHMTSSGQPHFYRPATQQERRDPSVMLYSHGLDDGTSVLVKRITVANHAELLTAFCTACAEERDTAQVLCFQRTLAKGEVVGLKKHDATGGAATTTA